MFTTLTPDQGAASQSASDTSTTPVIEPVFRVGSEKNASGMSLQEAVAKTDLTRGKEKTVDTSVKAPEVPKEVKETNKELSEVPKQDKSPESKPAKVDGKTSPLDKIDAPEEVKTEKTPDQGGDSKGEDELPDIAPKEQEVWTRTKKENRELKAKFKELEPKLKELEERASKFDESKLKEYEETIEWRARERFKETPEYKEKAAAPYSEGLTKINQVSEFTGVATKDLMEALMEPNDLLRMTKVNKLMANSGNELDDKAIDASVQAILKADDLIQKGTAEHNRFMEEAQAKREQYETRQSAEKLKAESEAKKIRGEALATTKEELMARMNDLVKAKYISETDFDDFMEAEDSGEPMDAAFRTAMEHMGPKFIKIIRDLAKENKALKDEAKESRGTKPSVNPATPKTNGAPAYGSLAEARAAQRGHVMGR
jgi:hypothetical protein